MAKTDFKNIDEYIETRDAEERKILQQIRETIQKAVPDAVEVISYQIPAFRYHGFIFYFSAFTKHYSLSCPPPWTIFEKFNKELEPYERSKSTIQFPKDKPFPFNLVTKMSKFRAEENVHLENAKPKKRKSNTQ